jgi:hypothetical protein
MHVQVPATWQHRDGTKFLKWLHQNACETGDWGIILKGPKGSTGLRLYILKKNPQCGR